MSIESFEEEIEELSSAEDFLAYFGIGFDQKTVHVNRLHIMQRFHDYLANGVNKLADAGSEQALREIYTQLLTRAYDDFVESDALTEKVFKVFRMHEPQTTFVPLGNLLEG
jgi:nitrogenase-stabilizing/protective protein